MEKHAMELEKFDGWLKRSAGLTDKSASDVVSRLRRASRFVNVNSKQAIEDVIHKLGKDPNFNKLTDTVRSQLRRAVKLYRQYEDGRD
jgi:DNA (cytosine-5)-methyltransferase 1